MKCSLNFFIFQKLYFLVETIMSKITDRWPKCVPIHTGFVRIINNGCLTGGYRVGRVVVYIHNGYRGNLKALDCLVFFGIVEFTQTVGMFAAFVVLRYFVVENILLNDNWDSCQFIIWLKNVRTIEA